MLNAGGSWGHGGWGAPCAVVCQSTCREPVQRLESQEAGVRGREGRNDKDLTEAEEIKKRCQEYVEELYKTGLYDPDNHNGVVTYLEPHILEYEVKWPLGSITMNKDRRVDGISASLFQS